MIEVYEDCLTIGTKQFPDDCVSLDPEETEEVLRLLVTWKEGTQQELGYTPQVVAAAYSQGIWVTPTKFRSWG